MGNEQEVSVVFRTRAELEGAKAVLAELERAKGKAMALGQDTGKVAQELAAAQARMASAKVEIPKGDFIKELRGSLGEVIPGFARLDGLITKIGTGSMAAAAAGAATLAGGLMACVKAIDAFRPAEQAVTKLDAALAQAGQLTDDYRARLQELAEALESATGKDSYEWMEVLGRLTQFGADSGNIGKAADAVKNLAGVLGGDLQTASMLVARALQGNYEQFGRYGIRVNEAGTATEKFDQMCQEVARRGGGQLEAQTKTISGWIWKFKDAVDDILVSIGTWISKTGVLQGALEILVFWLQAFNDLIRTVIPSVGGLENAQNTAAEATRSAAEAEQRQARALEQTRREADAARGAMDSLVDSIRRRQRLQDEEDDAQMASELAQVDAAVASGRMSEDQATQTRYGIRQHYQDQRYRRAQAANRDESNALQGANDQDAERLRMTRDEVDNLRRTRDEWEYESRRRRRGHAARDVPEFNGAMADQLQYLENQMRPGSPFHPDAVNQRMAERSGRITVLGEEAASRTRVWMSNRTTASTQLGTQQQQSRNQYLREALGGQMGMGTMDRELVGLMRQFNGNFNAMAQALTQALGMSNQQVQQLRTRVQQLESRMTNGGR